MAEINFYPLRDIHEIDGLICGIKPMDEFLHSDMLYKSLKASKCDSYVAKDNNNNVIAFFALCESTLELDDDYKEDLNNGWLDAAKPEFETEEELKAFLECSRFEVVDIAYLAVSKDVQRCGYGTEIMKIIFDLARIKKPDGIFMTVDALFLKDENYSAAEFYEKFGFQRMYPAVSDTIRMFCTVYPHLSRCE